MLAGTVGSSLFPRWQMYVRTYLPDGTTFDEPLRDGYVTTEPGIVLGVGMDFNGKIEVFSGLADPVRARDGIVPGSIEWFPLDLALGTNRIGFYAIGYPPEYPSDEYFTDFERVPDSSRCSTNARSRSRPKEGVISRLWPARAGCP